MDTRGAYGAPSIMCGIGKDRKEEETNLKVAPKAKREPVSY
jgi:hypothetical protein